MKYEDWRELTRKMAVQSFIIDAGDMMLPSKEARARAENILRAYEAKENMLANSEVFRKWANREYEMGNAILALEDLGYTIEYKAKGAT